MFMIVINTISKMPFRSCKMRCFCDSKMDQGFCKVSTFQLTHRSPRHMCRRRDPCRTRQTSTKVGGSAALGASPIPDKKEARGDRGTGSDASAALAALGGGPGLQSCSVTG